MKINNNKWDKIIDSKKSKFIFNLYEIIQYKDLIKFFIKRDFVVFYKQTILGPLWYVIQPLVNTIVFTVIFGNLAKIPTDGNPPFLFYLSGTVIWSYFAICLTTTSRTFLTNAHIFGKVYFPRVSVPLSNVIFSLVQFFLQFIIFLFFYIYFFTNGTSLNFNINLLIILPLLLLQTAFLGLGFGLLISSLTTKYRDLNFVMDFFVQLWMFATPIVYPLSLVPDNYKLIIAINPMTSVVEIFRKIFFDNSAIQIEHIIISLSVTIIIFILGIINFNRVERNFMDTI